MGWQNQPEITKKERECNCCIEIDNSIVVIICGEVDIERLKNCLQTALEVKSDAAAEQE